MQSSNHTPTDNLDNNNNFSENRKAIKQFFVNNQLRSTLHEFYEVQNNFHKNMAKLVRAFSNMKKEALEDNNKYLLSELLQPYRILAKNMFRPPSGDNEKDIEHILQVINKRSEEFETALNALLNSASDLKTFTKLMEDYKQDEELAPLVKKEFENQSWLSIQGHIDQPFQNLIRYESFLKVLKECLEKAGCENTEAVFTNLLNSIQFLLPEVQNINDCSEIILLLNKIDRMLGNLLADVLLKDEMPSQKKIGQLNIKDQIEFTMICVKTGKTNIIQGNQNIVSLYEGLLDLLKGIEETLTSAKTASKFSLSEAAQAYVTSASNYMLSLPGLLFNGKDSEKLKHLDPLQELKEIIKNLTETIEQTEALQHIQERLLRNRR